MPKNKIGRDIPEYIEGIGELRPYNGPFSFQPTKRKYGREISQVKPGDSKLLDSIEKAVIKTELKDGMTISFHHHFREGDYILNMVLDKIGRASCRERVS